MYMYRVFLVRCQSLVYKWLTVNHFFNHILISCVYAVKRKSDYKPCHFLLKRNRSLRNDTWREECSYPGLSGFFQQANVYTSLIISKELNVRDYKICIDYRFIWLFRSAVKLWNGNIVLCGIDNEIIVRVILIPFNREFCKNYNFIVLIFRNKKFFHIKSHSCSQWPSL